MTAPWGTGDGWHVLHDLARPSSGATVEHVIVTPAGPFVIDFKHRDEASAELGGGLWASRGSRQRDLAHLRWEMAIVADALRDEPHGPVAVGGIVAVTGCPMPADPLPRARGVDVVPLDGIVRLLAGKRRRHDADDVRRIAAVLDQRLRVRPVTVSPRGAGPVALAS